MPRYCAAQDCSNSVCYSGRPAHKFPSEPTLRKLWIRAARPSQPTWKPAKGDCLCTEHFEDEDYKTSPKLLQSLGLPVKQAYLKPGVVPSLFTRKRKRERHSGAVEKRRRKEATVKHLYWCAESSDGAPEEILSKWTFLVGHVADLHEHAYPLYPRCQHGDLGKKKWLPECE
ncbi:hypothetical protein ISCGN_003421 [Ixodes scapularis]